LMLKRPRRLRLVWRRGVAAEPAEQLAAIDSVASALPKRTATLCVCHSLRDLIFEIYRRKPHSEASRKFYPAEGGCIRNPCLRGTGSIRRSQQEEHIGTKKIKHQGLRVQRRGKGN